MTDAKAGRSGVEERKGALDCPFCGSPAKRCGVEHRTMRTNKIYLRFRCSNDECFLSGVDCIIDDEWNSRKGETNEENGFLRRQRDEAQKAALDNRDLFLDADSKLRALKAKLDAARAGIEAKLADVGTMEGAFFETIEHTTGEVASYYEGIVDGLQRALLLLAADADATAGEP
jgi:hypothetical protein